MLSKGSGTTTDVTRSNRRMTGYLSRVRYGAGNGGRRGGERRRKERPATRALASFKVAITRTDRPLSRFELVSVHRDTHAATRLTPLGSSRLEYAIQTLGLGFPFHGL